MNLDRVTAGKNPPHEINVIVEIPLHGAPVKYELDKETGAMFVDRFLNTSMHYPCNYGYIPKTLAKDGDPVDVIILQDMGPFVDRGIKDTPHIRPEVVAVGNQNAKIIVGLGYRTVEDIAAARRVVDVVVAGGVRIKFIG